ncbi:MAG TPA: hypothetical protein VGG42_18940 [Acidobacteriaceae bacterium]|jgi:hypothetical protein
MSLAHEQHYSPVQLAKRWGWSSDFVRDLFEHEPGVLKVERPERMNKRRYTSLRIPESVAAKVHFRLRNH